MLPDPGPEGMVANGRDPVEPRPVVVGVVLLLALVLPPNSLLVSSVLSLEVALFTPYLAASASKAKYRSLIAGFVRASRSV